MWRFCFITLVSLMASGCDPSHDDLNCSSSEAKQYLDEKIVKPIETLAGVDNGHLDSYTTNLKTDRMAKCMVRMHFKKNNLFYKDGMINYTLQLTDDGSVLITVEK